ncbi:hypothetical protein ACFC09_35405 [Streptomyces sp. NPDC056161]|uniref:hypothetical protein n=1 Tax=Streptomyces sp. NPDC056161 TaxID=3345732 RepID=UPI0035DBFDBD
MERPRPHRDRRRDRPRADGDRRCADENDVLGAVRLAQDPRLRIAVRGGGTASPGPSRAAARR